MRTGKEKKEHYEMEIKHLADEFFAIPKEDTALASKRNSLKGKLWVALWLYYKDVQYTGLEIDSEITAEKYSGIINETIVKSMEAYKTERGTPFLHYINAAVKNEISRERQKNYLHGLKVPQKIFGQWKQLVQLAHSRGIDGSDINKIRELGFVLGYSESILEQVLDFGKVKIYSDRTELDGKESSVFDMLESDMSNPEKEFKKKEEVKNALHQFRIIDEVFQKKQERVKPYVSALLTLEFYTALIALFQETGQQAHFKFIHQELYAELKEREHQKRPKPTQQAVAARFGKDKTDASRTLRRFFQEIRQKVSTLL